MATARRIALPLAALVAALACAGPTSPAAPPLSSSAQLPPPTPAAEPPPVAPPSPESRIEDENNTIAVFKAAAPATVYVTQNQLVRDKWSFQTISVPAGTGSGYVWNQQGDIVTNYHVVDGGRSFTVTLQDQSSWDATVVGGDPRKDIAVLHIDAPADKLVPVAQPPADYDLEVGQQAIAIGNPFGLDHTLTVGVISATGREIVGYGNVTIKGMIQTDASINPGNSGGPLLDSSGRLIGMNTMIYSPDGQSAGIGFAVPYPTVKHVVDQILTKGRVETVGIGITPLPDAVARRLGAKGVVVYEVQPGSPAAVAGLESLQRTPRGGLAGDVIVSVDDATILSFDDLYNALDGHHPGESIHLGWLRGGKTLHADVQLIEESE
jgi:S1-C subfamily serine protease